MAIAMSGFASASDRAAALIEKLKNPPSIYTEVSVELTADLRSRPDTKSIGELVGLLKSPDRLLQEKIILILEDVAGQQPASFDDSIPDLISVIPELKARDRTIAIRTLGTLGRRASAAVDLLRPYSAGQHSATIYERAWSAAALIKICGRDDEATAVLLDLLKSTQTDDQIAATAALAFTAEKADAVDAALHLRLSDTDIRVRTLAAKALLRIGSKPAEIMPTLRDALREPASFFRTLPMEKYAPLLSQHDVAMLLIREIGADARDAVPELISLLASSDWMDRLAAVLTLSAIGPDASPAADSLRKLAKDPDGDVRRAAKAALLKIAPEK